MGILWRYFRFGSDHCTKANITTGLPGGAKRTRLPTRVRCKTRQFTPWVGKISWRGEWQPSPVFFAWRIPWTEEPGRLQFLGLHGVRHDWSDLAHSTNTRIKWIIHVFWLLSVCKIMIAAQCAIALCLKNVQSGSAVKESACSVGVLSLGREDPPEKEMATHSSILVWGMPWTEGLAGHSPCARHDTVCV